MEPKREPFKNTKILITDKDISTEKPSPEASVDPIAKKEAAKKLLFDNSPEKRVALNLKTEPKLQRTTFEFEATKTFIDESKELPISETIIEPQATVEIDSKIEKESEIDSEKSLLDEKEFLSIPKKELLTTTEKEKISAKNIQRYKKAKPGLKTRLKIIFFGFVAVLTCFMGWSIYNASHIETLRSQLQESNKIYAVNIANYINNISKTDDLTSADSLFNLEQLSNANIITIAPTVEPYVEYSVKSNWFDRICNWFSSFFK